MTEVAPAETDNSTYHVGAVRRALRIVDYLAECPGLGAGLSQIARDVELPRPTVKRLLSNLVDFGYVSQDQRTESYHLGLRLLEYGNLVAGELPITGVARPHIRQLMEATGETVHLAVLDGRHVVYVDKIEPDRAIRMVSRIGARLPAHCTALGKSMLALLPDPRLESLLGHVHLERPTERAVKDLDGLRSRLKECRGRGFALDDEEVEPGLRCIGAAVQDGSGHPLAAVSLSAPLERLGDDRVSEIGAEVAATAAAIAADLNGGRR